ncbi:MAG: hypothetical protein ACPL7K_04080 [Armatimonadota bacterium]
MRNWCVAWECDDDMFATPNVKAKSSINFGNRRVGLDWSIKTPPRLSLRK